MFKKIKLSAALSTIALAFFAPLSSATVVDFTGLIDGTNYTENGMVMTSSNVKRWNGSDIAYMVNDSVAIFKLASNNDFSLTSINMFTGSGSVGTGPARFNAYNNGQLLGFDNVNGKANPTYYFTSIFDSIDEFRIVVFNEKSVIFDNINFGPAITVSDLNTVPEPGTLALVGLSLAGLALATKRKNA